MSKCKECKAEIETCYSHRQELIERQMCFTCSFWYDYVLRKHDKNCVRIHKNHYVIGEEDDTPPEWRGFAGDKFIILFNDGRKVITTNFWHQGRIPCHFQDRLSDNAIFIRE